MENNSEFCGMKEELLTVNEFAKLYVGEKGKKVSRQQIHNLIKKGVIKAKKYGRDYMICSSYLVTK